MNRDRYPKMFRVRQQCTVPALDNVAAAVRSALAGQGLEKKIQSGDRVAVTVGSRGIANIAQITKEIVDHVRQVGGEPVIVPAMGSHGGGTAAGQRQLIESLGVSEQYCGCPIESSIETVVAASTNDGIPIHFDRVAYERDHVIVANRIKPHTTLDGPIQSGLLKMLLIGLGNAAGAKTIHGALLRRSLADLANEIAPQLFDSCGILTGLAIIENARDEVAHVEAIAPGRFIDREAELLTQAREWMARLPLVEVDVLVIDEIGKDISGTGMDTNVVGRKQFGDAAGPDELPKVRRILVRGLSQRTHGNAMGIGLADFCNRRVLDAMDVDATQLNAITSGRVAAAKLPMSFVSDREMLNAALTSIGSPSTENVRVVWIRNTLDIAEFAFSEAYREEVSQRDDLEIAPDAFSLSDLLLATDGS